MPARGTVLGALWLFAYVIVPAPCDTGVGLSVPDPIGWDVGSEVMLGRWGSDTVILFIDHLRFSI